MRCVDPCRDHRVRVFGRGMGVQRGHVFTGTTVDVNAALTGLLFYPSASLRIREVGKMMWLTAVKDETCSSTGAETILLTGGFPLP